MHDREGLDPCLTRGGRTVSDAMSSALGGAPWLRNDVRRAARCWLPTRDRPRRRRQHGSGRCHLARRDRGKNVHMNCESATGLTCRRRSIDRGASGCAVSGARERPRPRRRRKRRERRRLDRTAELATTRAAPAMQVGGTVRSGGNRLTKWSSAASVASPLQRRVRLPPPVNRSLLPAHSGRNPRSRVGHSTWQCSGFSST